MTPPSSDRQPSPAPADPAIVRGGTGKRPLGSTRQRDLVRASLLLCPPSARGGRRRAR